MIEENDVVKSNKKINDQIGKGTVGAVLSVYNNGEAFLVEFIDANGNTIGDGMETCFKNDIDLFIKVKKN